jgi:hypothetical protein
MDIQSALLCDSAADYNGKLCILGSFDTIVAHKLPAVHPQCSIALRILFRKEEEGQHRLRVNIVDEDGRSIIPAIDGMIEVKVPGDFFFISRNLVFNMQQLKFEKAGLYAVDVTVGEGQVISIPLQVKLATGPPPF